MFHQLKFTSKADLITSIPEQVMGNNDMKSTPAIIMNVV